MKKCLILGGGLAGLTAAVYLSRSNYAVEIIESSPKLGGRTYSFIDKETGTELDNGQHIMMGCYKETLNLVDIIKSRSLLDIQPSLEVIFLKEGYRDYKLKAARLPYPINLLSGFMKYKALSFSERVSVLKFLSKLAFVDLSVLEDISVSEWLRNEKQFNNSIKSFWGILAVGALNTNIHKASAKIFAVILKEIFLKGGSSSSIILPLAGLSKIFSEPAEEYVNSRGGKISLSENVNSFEIKDYKITAVRTSKRIIKDFDIVISAVPSYALKRISDQNIPDLEYSTIVSIHIWLKENRVKEKFLGLIGSPVHWIFNHGNYLSLVISDADYLSETTSAEIFAAAASELKKYVNIGEDSIEKYKVIKEKRATFVPSPGILKKRPKTMSSIDNLLLAGDWIQTGLPSTIESAVKSGKIAAFRILNGYMG